METQYDQDIKDVEYDISACERALNSLSAAKGYKENIAAHVAWIQSGVDRCFFVAAGANVQTYVDPLIEKIETAETIIKTKIGRLEADFAYLETLRTNYIREAEAAAQAE